MDKINKFSLPATILIGCLILGGFYYVTETSKQAAAEQQQQTVLQVQQQARLQAQQDSLQAQQASLQAQQAAQKTSEEISALEKKVNSQTATQNTLSSKQIVDLLSPSVVLIATTDGAGSGFVIDDGKYILTNAHVVGSYSFVNVYVKGGYFGAPVLGKDTGLDIALIYSGGHNLASVKLGSSDAKSLSVGDDVYTLGYPLSASEGLTNLTIAKGILSARQTPSWANRPLLQTDASINHGNSGGPLVNSKGEVVGINTYTDASVFNQTQGIYFAIPIDTVAGYIPSLSQYGKSSYELQSSPYDTLHPFQF